MHRALRTTLAAGLIAGALTPLLTGPLRAQQQATTDLAAESRFAPDAMVTVLDSAVLRAGRGRTLADFLAGRVPGLQVTYESGQPGAAPRVITRASYGNFADATPLLYIDGVLWRDDGNWLARDAAWAIPSFGWQMLVDEIEEVRVHLGAASGTMLEFGASRGVVLVTTRRPAEGAGRIRASVQATTAAFDPKPMYLMGRSSTIPTSPPWGCTLARAEAAACAPDEVLWLSAHDLAPIHERASSIDATVDGTATLAGTRLHFAATRSHLDGTLPSSARSTTTLAASAERGFGSRLAAAIDLRGGRAQTGVADRSLFTLRTYPFVGSPFTPESTTAFIRRTEDAMLLESPGRVSQRLTVGGRVSYQLDARTTIAVRVSSDRYWRGHESEFTLPGGEARRLLGRAHTSSTAIGLRIERSHSFAARVHADFILAGSVTNAEVRDSLADESYDTGFGQWFGTRMWLDGDARDRSALGGARLRIGERLRLAGSVRHEARRGYNHAPSLQSVNGEYLLRRAGEQGPLGLTLFGGYGESVDHRTVGVRGDGGRPSQPEFTIETELGLRATRGDRFVATLSHARTRVNDGLVGFQMNFIPPYIINVDADASWRVDATTLVVALRGDPARRVPWNASASLMRRDHVLTRFVNAFERIDGGEGFYLRSKGGRPLDEIVSSDYTFDDVNGDGIISPAEVTLSGTWNGQGGTEPRLFLTLGGDVEPWRGIRLGTVMEGRFGQRAADAWAARRCTRSLCRELFDADASLAEQAAAIVAERNFVLTGFVRDAGFVRIREVYLEAAPSLLRGSRVRLAAHQVLAWTRFANIDPEARARRGARAVPDVGTSQPLYPSISLRVDFDY